MTDWIYALSDTTRPHVFTSECQLHTDTKLAIRNWLVANVFDDWYSYTWGSFVVELAAADAAVLFKLRWST